MHLYISDSSDHDNRLSAYLCLNRLKFNHFYPFLPTVSVEEPLFILIVLLVSSVFSVCSYFISKREDTWWLLFTVISAISFFILGIVMFAFCSLADIKELGDFKWRLESKLKDKKSREKLVAEMREAGKDGFKTDEKLESYNKLTSL